MTIDGIFNIFYGLIQGITEFIPISSSGHLNIIEILYKNIESRNYLYSPTSNEKYNNHNNFLITTL